MSYVFEAARVVATNENISLQYALSHYEEAELLDLAKRYNRERERNMDAIREGWM